jgi:AraC-like DNA-binding protein/mannose-6-phosphate isomerase-like protein (cupin superfamily)
LKDNSDYKFTRLKLNNGIEIALADDNKFLFRKHFHNSFCIGFISKGVRHIEIGNGKIEVNKGDTFIINPGELHSCSTPDNSKCNYIVISISGKNFINLLQNSIELNTEKISFINFISGDEINTDLFEELINTVKNNVDHLEIQKFTEKILTRLFLLYSKAQEEIIPGNQLDDVIRKAKLFIEENYLENISLKDLSSELGISLFHFCRLFYKQAGLAPHEYQVLLRIKNSSKMLDLGMSPSEAAYENGFADQAYFTRVFKKYNGITPGKFISSKL